MYSQTGGGAGSPHTPGLPYYIPQDNNKRKMFTVKVLSRCGTSLVVQGRVGNHIVQGVLFPSEHRGDTTSQAFAELSQEMMKPRYSLAKTNLDELLSHTVNSEQISALSRSPRLPPSHSYPYNPTNNSTNSNTNNNTSVIPSIQHIDESICSTPTSIQTNNIVLGGSNTVQDKVKAETGIHSRVNAVNTTRYFDHRIAQSMTGRPLPHIEPIEYKSELEYAGTNFLPPDSMMNYRNRVNYNRDRVERIFSYGGRYGIQAQQNNNNTTSINRDREGGFRYEIDSMEIDVSNIDIPTGHPDYRGSRRRFVPNGTISSTDCSANSEQRERKGRALELQKHRGNSSQTIGQDGKEFHGINVGSVDCDSEVKHRGHLLPPITRRYNNEDRQSKKLKAGLCNNCHATQSTIWRRGGGLVLCN
eukprot:Ihof_evm4s120 gene=Ihof_evmTU4s120